MDKKRKKAMTKPQKVAATIAGIIQFLLLAAAQIDITQRSEAQINGSKLFWRVVVLVNFLGPIAYFLFGRKRTAHPA